MTGKRRRSITSTSFKNTSLHSAYLEFAIRSACAKSPTKRSWSIPVSRNVVEAIRYSYDFIDAACEYTYQVFKSGPNGDTRPTNWLTRYIDRQWTALSLADKLGFVAFTLSGDGFWANDEQRCLFEELKTVRNALTHPGLFGVQTNSEYPDFDSPPLSSRKTFSGKMRRVRNAFASFAEHPGDLDLDDARKAVEIALRHAERFEQLFGSLNSIEFGRTDSRGKRQRASMVLSRIPRRHFDSIWTTS